MTNDPEYYCKNLRATADIALKEGGGAVMSETRVILTTSVWAVFMFSQAILHGLILVADAIGERGKRNGPNGDDDLDM